MVAPRSDESSAADGLAAVQRALSLGAWNDALAACDAALAQGIAAQRRGEILVLRAAARCAAGDPATARNDVGAALGAWREAGGPVLVDELVALARTLASGGERQAAVRFLAAAVEVATHDTATARAAVDLGVIAVGLGEEAVARRSWQSATHGNAREAAAARINLARLEVDAGAPAAAVEHIRAVLESGLAEHAPSAVALALDVAVHLLDAGNPTAVAAVLDSLPRSTADPGAAARLTAARAAFAYDRGVLAAAAGDTETAATQLLAALDLEPDDEMRAGALMVLAGVDIACGRMRSACERGMSAAALARDDIARIDAGGVLVDVGEAAAARGEWTTAADAYAGASAVYASAGRLDLARAFSAAAAAGRGHV